MAVTNSLKKQIDLPVWEWCRFAPVVAAAGANTCSDESSGGRYVYYLAATPLFYRYDTWTDGWQQLATPTGLLGAAITTGAIGSMRYTIYGGYRGKVISATSTTVDLPGLQGQKLVGKKIRITSGTGAGQERTITAVTEPTIYEQGGLTAITNTAAICSIQDNQTIPKKWKINQWTGYQCRVVFGTGLSQVRKILYNDTNTLYFQDQNWQPYDPWNNMPFSAVAPYALPVIIAASAGAFFYIEKSTATVAQWNTTPDSTSKFSVLSGGIWLGVSTTAALGVLQWQYYDILSDTWFNKTKPSGNIAISLASDISIERTGEVSGSFTSGTSSGGGDSRNFIDSTATFGVDRYANYQLRVTNPVTRTVQKRRILSNTNTIMYVDEPWETIPGTTMSTYEVYGDTNAIWVTGNGQSSIYKYMIEEDLWTQGQDYDSGVVANMTYQKPGCVPFNATTIAISAGVLTVNTSAFGNAGTGYKVGDICSVTTGGTGCKIRITSITPSTGAVTGIELYANGAVGTHTTGPGKVTANVIPAAGGGASLTVEVLTVGAVAQATTTIAHDFAVGDSVVHMGAGVAAWNATYSITTCDSTTTFYFIPPNTTAPVAASANSATLIVDASKNWTPGEHIGKAVTMSTLGLLPTTQNRKITANTATSLTVSTGTTAMTIGAVGTSRYVIHDLNSFGREDQTKISGQDGDGWATSGSPTTLVDNTKTWIPGMWIGYKLRVISGTGYDKGEIAISANDATTLTITTPGFTPDTTTRYRIMQTWGIATGTFAATTLADSTKNWAVNQWAGRSLRLWGLTTGVTPLEVIIASNTANTLTYATTTIVSEANTCYTILAPAQRQIGIQAMWNYGSSQTSIKGKYIYIPRGGSTVAIGFNYIDRYIITEDRWDLALLQNPQFESEFLGSQWAYDGVDRIYWTPSGTVTRVFAIDINKLTVDPIGIHPYANGAGVQGNRLEIIETEDGLKYIYILRSSGAEFWRTLLWI